MTNETKQTAVDYLVEQLPLIQQIGLKFIIEEAKEMEKEQKQFMFNCGRQYQLTGEGTFTEVYNETYGGNK